MTKTYTLKIKSVGPEDVRIPRAATHRGDSGVDLFNGKIINVENNPKQYKIDFLIQCEVVCFDDDIKEEKNVSFYLYPRSNIAKTPFRMSNSIGLIDAGYRGNLMAYVDVINNSDIVPLVNESYFQIVLPNLKPIDTIEIVNELSNTSRGSGGFGSTNVNRNN